MNELQEQPSVFAKLADAGHVAQAELADASVGAKIGTFATLGCLGFEWGTGNEALLGTVGGNVLQLSHNPLITGLATGAASAVEQSVIGVLMATTIASYPRVTSAIRDMIPSRPENEAENDKPPKTKRFIDVMVLGSAAELVKENAKTPNTKPENIKRALASAAIIGTANVALITSASTLISEGSKHGFESQAGTVVDIMSNPLTWAGLFISSVVIGKARRAVRRRRNLKQKPSEGVVDDTAE